MQLKHINCTKTLFPLAWHNFTLKNILWMQKTIWIQIEEVWSKMGLRKSLFNILQLFRDTKQNFIRYVDTFKRNASFTAILSYYILFIPQWNAISYNPSNVFHNHRFYLQRENFFFHRFWIFLISTLHGKIYLELPINNFPLNFT